MGGGAWLLAERKGGRVSGKRPNTAGETPALPGLRGEAVDLPAAVVAGIEEAVVEAAGAALPEFDGFRDDPVAAPERGQGDFTLGELRFHLGEFLQEERARRYDRALLGHPGTELGIAGTRGEIAERFGGADLFRAPLDDDLALQREPGEQQRGFRVGRELARLAAFVVGEKHEAVAVEVFQ